MNKEQETRLSKLKFKHSSQANRLLGFVTHTQHQDYRKTTIGKLLKLDMKQVDQLLQCLKAEWKYVEEGGKK
jgi:hypothetical protein